MSIPKEPRQLMINIMYLVLTAMLALNVSAEIINAFFLIDHGIEGSNKVIDKTNEFTFTALEASVLQDKAKYGSLLVAAREVEVLSKEFDTYVSDIRENLTTETGGMYPEDDPNHPGHPKGYKNKDITTRVLVDEGKGAELRQRIIDDRAKMLSIVNKLKDTPNTQINEATLKELEESITLQVSDDWQKSDKPSWEAFLFKQMPLASVYPLLRKFQNDMKSSEAAVINYLVNNVGATTFKVDQFVPISSAKKSYVIAGEPYEAELSVGAISSSVAENMTIRVNGSPVTVKDGVAQFTTTPTATGVKEYKVDVTLTNPTTGTTDTYSKTFEYEVGRRSVSVSADKMNVFYIGVDNPVSVAAAGVSSNELKVSGSGVNLSGSNGKYTATASAPGEATITVSGGGLTASRFNFRVKRIPDPQARLSQKAGGEMGTGEFKAQGGVGAYLDNFDFDATCQVVGYQLVYAPARQDPIISENPGARYNDKSMRIVSQAKPGDRYFFENVRAKCPGDSASRKINDMVFKIR